jgi:dihydropteroate synthase
MGIVNVTPDSFSNAGEHADLQAAIEAALAMEADGADIIDVGGESTRPGSDAVGVDEEMARVIPVVEGLTGRLRIPISIDTRKPEVARRAVEAGAAIINDVTAFADDAMVELAAKTGAGCVLMHMLGEPKTMQDEPVYGDVMGEITAFLDERAGRLGAAGVGRERIVVDPGIGFGKTLRHNLEVFDRLGELAGLGHPILVGPSRKRFIGDVLGTDVGDRLEGTAAAVSYAIVRGAHIVRVHDVKEMVRVVRMTDALVRGAVEG